MVNLCWQILFQTTCKKHISKKTIPLTINKFQKTKSFENLKSMERRVKSQIFS